MIWDREIEMRNGFYALGKGSTLQKCALFPAESVVVELERDL